MDPVFLMINRKLSKMSIYIYRMYGLRSAFSKSLNSSAQLHQLHDNSSHFQDNLFEHSPLNITFRPTRVISLSICYYLFKHKNRHTAAATLTIQYLGIFTSYHLELRLLFGEQPVS